MEFLKFLLSNGKINTIEYDDQKSLFVLADFLKDAVRLAEEYITKWLGDSSSTFTGVYEIDLEKVGNKIILSYDWNQNAPLEEQDTFETTKEQLHYIINRWQELIKKDAKEILITRDGDKITVEGKF